jgi:hypothetical protein
MKTLQKKLLLFLLILPIGIFAQGTLKGVVLDGSSQQPLPSVNIIVEGTTTGTTSDFDGNFTLSNIKNGDKIVFSYLGFLNQTITYNGQKEITVTLQEDAQQLKDVVVIGYGTVKKKDATGSVNTVTTKDFVKGPVVAADQMIQGKVAGVQITNGGGAPGEVGQDPARDLRGGAGPGRTRLGLPGRADGPGEPGLACSSSGVRDPRPCGPAPCEVGACPEEAPGEVPGEDLQARGPASVRPSPSHGDALAGGEGGSRGIR